ncbi:MAG: glycosyltransferase [Negativicutes bacterium]|nr:glycosyltransferase [Negativicutes bacterium]
MYFSYFVSVIMVSLALYGGWLLLRDMWDMFIEPQLAELPSASFLIIVQDCEQEIEGLLYFLINQLERYDSDYDIVVVDNHSGDLTPSILARLSDAHPVVQVIRVPYGRRPVAEGMPLCRGGVVHVMEIGKRLSGEEFMAAVGSLLERDKREVAIVRHD